jgi:hypothetical protein
MKTHEVRERVIQLIQEGATLDPADSGEFHIWVESSHEALEPFPASQEQFDLYCRSAVHSRQMRAEIGLELLMLAAAKIED